MPGAAPPSRVELRSRTREPLHSPEAAPLPSSISPERLAYSIEEVADLTGISRSLVYDMMSAGRLEYIKVGRRRIITVQQLDTFLSASARAGAA